MKIVHTHYFIPITFAVFALFAASCHGRVGDIDLIIADSNEESAASGIEGDTDTGNVTEGGPQDTAPVNPFDSASSDTGVVSDVSSDVRKDTGLPDTSPQADCPNEKPNMLLRCESAGLICKYKLDQCRCTRIGWVCAKCPATKPDNHASCEAFFLSSLCQYDDEQCNCTISGWKCGACPKTAPDVDTACTVVSQRCIYGDYDCECNIMKKWHCSGCPNDRPADKSVCKAPLFPPGTPVVCDYDATTCVCSPALDTSRWTCGQCPQAEPPANSACPTQSLQCKYGSTTCKCASRRWNCS